MREQAERFGALFRALYLTYHQRDGPGSDLPGASRAVLAHLAVTGPLTIGRRWPDARGRPRWPAGRRPIAAGWPCCD